MGIKQAVVYVASISATSCPAPVPERRWDKALLFEVLDKSVIQQFLMISVDEGGGWE